MKFMLKPTDIAEIEFTLNITASLSEWMTLEDQLSHMSPSSQLRTKIVDMILKARAYWEEVDVKNAN